MTSAYGALQKPHCVAALPVPLECTLKNGSAVTVDLVDRADAELVERLRELMNAEIEAGYTYPQEEPLTVDGFASYFLAGDSFVARSNDGVVLGAFYVKPNFPGRSSHICNGGFIVSAGHRGLGVGRAMATAYLRIAPALGYRASVFNLVFESNTASLALWRSLGFREVGRLPLAGRLRSKGRPGDVEYVDALMLYYDFSK